MQMNGPERPAHFHCPHRDQLDDKQKMYDLLTDVYHSSFSETFNFIKFECEGAGVEYHGVKSAESGAEVLSNDEIFKLWENCLELK